MTPRQSQPRDKLLAWLPAPPSPKSNACFLWKGGRASAYGTAYRWSVTSYSERTRRTYHFAYAQPVEYTSTVIVYIVEDGTFARVEGDSESPLLPLDERIISDSERGTFWLPNIERLQVFPGSFRQKLRYVLGIGAMCKDITLMSLACH